jgi:hypothetical protein
VSPSLAVILLNYKRPQNIAAIVGGARAGLPDAPIFLLDQAERDDLRRRADIPWSEVWYQRARGNGGAGARVPLAARLPFDHYIAIDDDIFLTPHQLAALADQLRADPSRAHGVWGERLELNDDMFRFRSSLHGIDAALTTLNQVYAFSRQQAAAAIALSARLGFAAFEDAVACDDILLSCASSPPPLCHNLGPLSHCPTSGQDGIAVWRTDGFAERRLALASRLIGAGSIAVFSPLTVIGASR